MVGEGVVPGDGSADSPSENENWAWAGGTRPPLMLESALEGAALNPSSAADETGAPEEGSAWE